MEVKININEENGKLDIHTDKEVNALELIGLFEIAKQTVSNEENIEEKKEE